jgi:hypothetical protein
MYSFAKIITDHLFLQNRGKKYKKIPSSDSSHEAKTTGPRKGNGPTLKAMGQL